MTGIPELMAYLNGVNNSSWFGLKTFLVKCTSIVLIGVAGIFIGKTGTFAHIGAMIGMGVLYLPIKDIDFFHNDANKREFVAAGLSCGIAAAFGAPISGTLFGYEISQPNTYW
jgi:H+/Cl- antiporter ClcA